MTVVALDTALVADVARRMRASDRAEVGAMCWPGADEPEALAREAVMRSRFGGVVLDAGGNPQAVLGALPCWPGVFSVWMFATDLWPAVWRGAVRFARDVLARQMVSAGGHRAQCFAAAGHDDAHRLLRRLGFQAEGTARRMGRAGEDFIMFGAVR